jgi:AcrR family transcriptional regulator
LTHPNPVEPAQLQTETEHSGKQEVAGIRRRAPAKTRAKLVNAAFEIIAEKGMDSATLEEILKRADLSNGALYVHFANKDALLREAIASQTSIVLEGIEEVEALSIDPIARFAFIFRQAVEVDWNLSIAAEILSKARRDARVREIWVGQLYKIESAFSRWILEGQKTGIFRSDLSPAVAARLLTTLATGFLVVNEAGIPWVDVNEWIATMDGVVRSFCR